jgi:hypothetical protein
MAAGGAGPNPAAWADQEAEEGGGGGTWASMFSLVEDE